jgi:hypothetical protein
MYLSLVAPSHRLGTRCVKALGFSAPDDDGAVAIGLTAHVATRSGSQPLDLFPAGLPPMLHGMQPASQLPRSTKDEVQPPPTGADGTVSAEPIGHRQGFQEGR